MIAEELKQRELITHQDKYLCRPFLPQTKKHQNLSWNIHPDEQYIEETKVVKS